MTFACFIPSHELPTKGPLKIQNFRIEHRLRKEEMWRSSSTERQSKDGGVQRTQRGSPMKQQGLRILSTHQEESLLQSTANMGADVGEEEGAIDSTPGNEGRIAQAWVNVKRRFACLLGVLLAFRRLDTNPKIRFKYIFITEKLPFSNTFFLLKTYTPPRKAKCLFYCFRFGKNSRRKRPTRL